MKSLIPKNSSNRKSRIRIRNLPIHVHVDGTKPANRKTGQIWLAKAASRRQVSYRQATSAPLGASTMADSCRMLRLPGKDALKRLWMQSTPAGLGLGAGDMQIDSPGPFCYSTQFARCAGASCETIKIPVASRWKPVGVRRFRRSMPKWNAMPRKGAESIMGTRVAA